MKTMTLGPIRGLVPLAVSIPLSLGVGCASVHSTPISGADGGADASDRIDSGASDGHSVHDAPSMTSDASRGDAGEGGSFSITLGPAMQILEPGQLGLDSVPDVQLSYIQQA